MRERHTGYHVQLERILRVVVNDSTLAPHPLQVHTVKNGAVGSIGLELLV